MPKTSKEERREVMERIHELEAAIAEIRRAWIVDRKGTDRQQRVTLDAELAALRLRRLRLDYIVKDEADAQTAAARAEHARMLLPHLIDVLKERDLGAVITEAKSRMQQTEPA